MASPDGDASAVVLDQDLWGYKVVCASGRPTVYPNCADMVYRVGETYSVDESVQPLRLCAWGLHFSPAALDCLHTVTWGWSRRLLRVVAPAGTRVVQGSGKCAAATLTIMADVTADAARLLTGMQTRDGIDDGTLRWYACGAIHRHEGNEPASVTRSRFGHHVRKTWQRYGACFDGVDGRYWHLVYVDKPSAVVRAYSGVTGHETTVTPADADWPWLYDVATRKESFE